MANNQSIQFLRGTAARKAEVGSSTTLLAGQPFFETDTNRLYIGDGRKKLNEVQPIGGDISTGYDVVIESQEDMDDFVATIGSSSSIHSALLATSVNLNKGIIFPLTFYCFDGISGAVLNGDTDASLEWKAPSNESESNTAKNSTYAIRNIRINYGTESTLNDKGYVVKNATVVENVTVILSCRHTGVASSTVFLDCSTLQGCSCVSTFRSPTYDYSHFSGCSNLVNCTSEGAQRHAFVDCNVLIGCTISSASAPAGTCYGFETCNQLSDCSCTLKLSASTAVAYKSCTHLVNCKGSVTVASSSSTASGMYVFQTCSYCSNCVQYNGPTGPGGPYAWSDDCTFVDADTCPQYQSSISRRYLHIIHCTAATEGVSTKYSYDCTFISPYYYDLTGKRLYRDDVGELESEITSIFTDLKESRNGARYINSEYTVLDAGAGSGGYTYDIYPNAVVDPTPEGAEGQITADYRITLARAARDGTKTATVNYIRIPSDNIVDNLTITFQKLTVESDIVSALAM